MRQVRYGCVMQKRLHYLRLLEQRLASPVAGCEDVLSDLLHRSWLRAKSAAREEAHAFVCNTLSFDGSLIRSHFYWTSTSGAIFRKQQGAA